MSELTRIFRSEIIRLAKKEARALVEPTRKSALVARHEVVALKRRLAEVERQLAGYRKAGNGAAPAGNGTRQPGRIRRFSGKSVRAQRQRFGMSAEDFSKLLGVTSQAIYNWEHGTSRPRPALMEQLGALRRMPKREAVARVRALNGSGS